MMRYHAGSPQPEPLSEDDPSVPGWAHGKVDSLAFDIHDALKEFEVKSVPGMVPPPTAAPGATPPVDEPKPAAGSAAGSFSGRESARAISRWNACRVAGSGTTPSSRSSTEAQ